MRTKNILKLIAVSSVFMLSTSSCADWLAVDMEDGIMEDKLYETNEGFLASLNGVYSKMNETYGSTLSMGGIDVMAQYYNIAKNSNHKDYIYVTYNYTDKNFEKASDDLWTNLYGLIANLNTLLEHCDASDTALKPNYVPYVKGEALALRAMIHFDLLRIYGPIYSATTASNTTIPYQETSSKDIQPLLPASEIIGKVIRDLTMASDLLKTDKVRTDGVMNSDSEDPNENTDLRYRQYRLNYFAVRGLLARAYLWMGDKAKAYETAHEIIAENNKNKIFPWTEKSAVQSTLPDRLFSTEVLFGLYNLLRVKQYDELFSPSSKISTGQYFYIKNAEEAAEVDSKLPNFYPDLNDLRKAMWNIDNLRELDKDGVEQSQKAVCFKKYADVGLTTTVRYMIPLLRMSEPYLIAAECTDDLTEAIGYINSIRKYRNCVDIQLTEADTRETVQQYIDSEFAREVIGEGQLFFYYKRHAAKTMVSGTDPSATYDMALVNYVWPLPKVERDKRVTSK